MDYKGREREREMCTKNEVPSVPHSSMCLEKHEISTVSEFDMIARFIPTVKSVSSSEI